MNAARRALVLTLAILLGSCLRGLGPPEQAGPDGDADSDADDASCPGIECGGRCYGPEDCVDACSYTVADGWGACSARFAEGLPLAAARTLDLTGLSTAELCVTFCDPTAFSFHLADSPACDGYGIGDNAHFSNDAEIQVDGTTLSLYANDYGNTAGEGPWDSPDFVPATGCTERTLVVSDGSVSTSSGFEVSTPYALRLEPPTDDEGVPDSLWYVGPNGTVNGSRQGSGLVSMYVCLR